MVREWNRVMHHSALLRKQAVYANTYVQYPYIDDTDTSAWDESNIYVTITTHLKEEYCHNNVCHIISGPRFNI